MCSTWSGALNMLPRGPQIMQIPRGYQEKMFIVKVCFFVGKVEISFLRGEEPKLNKQSDSLRAKLFV